MGILDSVFGGGGGQDKSGTLQVPGYLKAPATSASTTLQDFLWPGQGEGKGDFGSLQPYPAYDQPPIAPPSDLQWEGVADYAGRRGDWEPFLGEAADIYRLGVPSIQAATSGVPALVGQGVNFDPNRIDEYVNPYRAGVVDELARLAEENLRERIFPAVNTEFTAAGQFGSSRHREFGSRAIRDSMRETLGQQRMALSDAYDQALGAYGADRLRFLQGAEALGQGTEAAAGAAEAIGRGVGSLGPIGQDAALRELTGTLEAGAVGPRYQQSLEDWQYGQFLERRDWPFSRLMQMMQVMQGAPQGVPIASAPQSPGTLAQIAGLGLAGVGLGNAGGFNFMKGFFDND